MKHATTGIAVLVLLLVLGICADGVLAVVVEVDDGNQGGQRNLPRPQVRGGPEPFDPNNIADDPVVEKPKVDNPEKETPIKEKPAKDAPKPPVDPKTVMINNATAAIAAAEKAIAEDNKELAVAELAKAKAALEALNKTIQRDKLRENMEYRSMDRPRRTPVDAPNAPKTE